MISCGARKQHFSPENLLKMLVKGNHSRCTKYLIAVGSYSPTAISASEYVEMHTRFLHPHCVQPFFRAVGELWPHFHLYCFQNDLYVCISVQVNGYTLRRLRSEDSFLYASRIYFSWERYSGQLSYANKSTGISTKYPNVCCGVEVGP